MNTNTDFNKVLNVQNHLEKSLNSILANIRKYSEYKEIAETLNITLTVGITDKKYVCETIQQIFRLLEDKRQFLTQKKFSEDIDFKVFKDEMIAIQDNITNMKTYLKKGLMNLQLDINNLEEDVNFYSEKMLDWSATPDINKQLSVSQYKQNTLFLQHRVKEVRDFMEFVHKSKKHENSWTNDDHQMFIKFYNKYRNVEILAIKLNEILPDISMEEIKKHTEWYEEYLKLKKKKNEAVLNWRKLKESKTTLQYTTNNNLQSKTIIPTEDSPESIQAKISKWKAEKEEQMRITRDIEKQQEKLCKEKEYLKKKHNNEIKKIVHKWKQTKSEMEQEEKSRRKLHEESERKQKALEANKLIKQFRSQDDMYIMKIREHKTRKIVQMPIRSKSSQTACRDPNRLLKPTKQWINRVRDDNFYGSSCSLILPIKKLPKLGIPEWRKPFLME